MTFQVKAYCVVATLTVALGYLAGIASSAHTPVNDCEAGCKAVKAYWNLSGLSCIVAGSGIHCNHDYKWCDGPDDPPGTSGDKCGNYASGTVTLFTCTCEEHCANAVKTETREMWFEGNPSGNEDCNDGSPGHQRKACPSTT